MDTLIIALLLTALPVAKSDGQTVSAVEFNQVVQGVATGADTQVTATGASMARPLADRFAEVRSVKDFGAVGNGSTNDTAAIQAALDSLTGPAGLGPGGTLFFPPGIYRVDGQIVLKHTGASPPLQPNVRIVGAGAHFSGQGSTPSTGTVLDLRGATAPAKIDTRGLGLLEITGVTLATLGGTDSTPFLYTTNTTLHVHGSAFWGNKSGAAADQDAIILGGLGTTPDATADSPFQGYGTVIERNYFNRIRRGVYGRVYANGVVIRDNTFWNTCGSNLAGGAAIEFEGHATNYCVGNVISGNLIEMVYYKYGVSLTSNCAQNQVLNNNLYDSNGTALGAVYAGASSIWNYVQDGHTPGALAKMVDATPTKANQHIGVDQGVASRLGNTGAFVFNASEVTQEAGSGATYAKFKANTGALETAYQKTGNISGSPWIEFYTVPDGGAEQAMARLRYYGANQTAIQVRGSAFSGIESPDGDMKIRVNTGSTLWFGDIGGTHLYWQQSTKSLVLNDATAKVYIGTITGPSISSGTAAPSASANEGSLYLRTGGADGGLYVRQSGAWVGPK